MIETLPIEHISCPYCGKITDMGIPKLTKINLIRKMTIWNNVQFRKGNRISSNCNFCNEDISVWLGKISLGYYLRLYPNDVDQKE